MRDIIFCFFRSVCYVDRFEIVNYYRFIEFLLFLRFDMIRVLFNNDYKRGLEEKNIYYKKKKKKIRSHFECRLGLISNSALAYYTINIGDIDLYNTLREKIRFFCRL